MHIPVDKSIRVAIDTECVPDEDQFRFQFFLKTKFPGSDGRALNQDLLLSDWEQTIEVRISTSPFLPAMNITFE